MFHTELFQHDHINSRTIARDNEHRREAIKARTEKRERRRAERRERRRSRT